MQTRPTIGFRLPRLDSENGPSVNTHAVGFLMDTELYWDDLDGAWRRKAKR